MAPNKNVPNPVRTLLTLLGVMAVLTAVMFIQGHPTPKLGLDLAGGTTVTLTAETAAGKAAPEAQMNEAVKIIRDRVNGSGLTDVDVHKEGDNQIVVSVPGNETETKEIVDLVSTAAQMQFRQVLVTAPAAASAAILPTPTASGSASPKPSASAAPSASASPSASSTAKNRALSEAFAAPTPTPSKSASPKATTSASVPPAAVEDGLNYSKVTDKQVVELFKNTTCKAGPPGEQVKGASDEKAKFVVACDVEGNEKFILGPTRILGTEVSDANAQAPDLQNNINGWQVALAFKGKGGEEFGNLTKEAAAAYATGAGTPESRIAIVLDGRVVSAPEINQGAILGGQATISGGASFTEDYARNLAQSLKYGALPIQFPEALRTTDKISSSLGADQLRGGLIAGAIGLGLVVLYCLFYYRALGVVAVASLAVAAAMTYVSVVILGENIGFRLSLPHIIGLIVSIGITADSFIVYFERIRDELRTGRPLRPSVEVAWQRARRTIIVADAVTFLAALVLYFLAVGGVKGFAFAMGLTTLIDVIVVFFFTKPLVALLARRDFFAKGHKLSGLDSHRLSKPTPVARLKRQEV
ncbi:protein translocase subunit SecD [Actinocorallia lasiicapitis]